MLTFNNRTALVTGAGRGIGKAIAETLARNGVTVICVSKSADSCGSAAAAINQAGGKARALAVDVADGAAVAKAAETLLAEFPLIDILVNNAGITRDGLLFRMSDADWNDVLATNLSSCFHWTKYLARPMTRARWGRIVNITSVSGIMGNAGQANYSAAKAGMIGLTKSLAREFAGRSVTVNAVAPGFIATEMTAKLGDEMLGKIKEEIPLKRLGLPQDVSDAVLFLASDAAEFITGQVLTVDGGLTV
ncbi:MAG TPA: 3-oxoacyl-[acyl-carrier-protein] reductase [Opitutaceae bacterium]